MLHFPVPWKLAIANIPWLYYRCSLRSHWVALLPPLRHALRLTEALHTTRNPGLGSRRRWECASTTFTETPGFWL